jgi:hypothetical protein
MNPNWFHCESGSGSSFYLNAYPDPDPDPMSQSNAKDIQPDLGRIPSFRNKTYLETYSFKIFILEGKVFRSLE